MLRSAEAFGEDHRGVIGGLGDKAEDQIVDGNRVAGLEIELGRLLGRGMGRDREVLIERDLLVLQRIEG